LVEQLGKMLMQPPTGKVQTGIHARRGGDERSAAAE
jgi:hypothetical protein